jgi:cyclophilin family peptidyl-prolyl cis-trans isomerase
MTIRPIPARRGWFAFSALLAASASLAVAAPVDSPVAAAPDRGASVESVATFNPRGRPIVIRWPAALPITGLTLYRGISQRIDTAPLPAPAAEPAGDSVGLREINLAQLFPRLAAATPPAILGDALSSAVLLVQAEGADGPIGSPLVLEPMVAPPRAVAADQRGFNVRFIPPAGGGGSGGGGKASEAYFSGWRVYPLRQVELETALGTLRLALRPDAAPRTARHFEDLVARGFYDGLTFHRVVGPSDAARPGSPESEGFLIQGGDPLGTGEGGPGFTLPLEPSTLPHELGTVSMARLNAPDSAGSQFFITLSKQNGRGLDGSYAAFARVQLDNGGAEVLQKLARVAVGPDDRPLEPLVIKRARLVPAPPLGVIVPAASEPAGR